MQVLTVARHEMTVHLKRRSFLLTTALVPLLGGALTILLTALGAPATGGVDVESFGELGSVGQANVVGLVDPGGFVVREPDIVEGVTIVRLADEVAGRSALRAGEVDVVYLLDPDYPDSAGMVRLAQGLTPALRDADAVNALLRANLWRDADESWLADAADPARRLTIETATGAVTAGAAGAYRPAILPALIAVLLYSTIFMLSSFLLQSVTTEKENRVIEILLTSVEPFNLLTGKVLGLAMLGLIQVSVWGLSGMLLTRGGTFSAVQLGSQQADPRTLALAGLYFALGFLFYASLLAGIGAIVPTFQESGPLTFAVLTPAWIPFLLIRQLLADPNGSMAVVLSLLPPTAPLVMMMRILSGPVPAWQVGLSLILLAVSAIAVLWMAARLFRASVLLAGTVPDASSVFRTIVHG